MLVITFKNDKSKPIVSSFDFTCKLEMGEHNCFLLHPVGISMFQQLRAHLTPVKTNFSVGWCI